MIRCRRYRDPSRRADARPAPVHPWRDPRAPWHPRRVAETFTDRDLRGARFVRCDLSGAVLRAVSVEGAEIDAPWLVESGGPLRVNGVDVTAYVDAELDRRFPGRALRHAEDPAALREAWAAVETAWRDVLARVATMPPGTTDVSVAEEWTLAETLRHLVMATDTWLRRAVLEVEEPYHPVGVPNAEYVTDGHDPAVFHERTPSWERVLEVRAERVAMVRDHLAGVTPADLTDVRQHPWAPPGEQHPETVLACLRTIVEEEWEHLRYAVRDLDAIEAGRSPTG